MKNISHNDYLDSFLDSVWAEQGLSKNTLISYEHDIKSFLNFLNINSVDLMYNRIGESGANILAEALTPTNKKVNEFLVDLTLPMHAFDLIFRRGAGKKGKKGKKKKK